MSPRIAKAEPRPDFTVLIDWADGSRSVADFKPWIAKGGVFAPLGDPTLFTMTMKIDWRGYSLGWPGDVEFSAQGLWDDDRQAARTAAE
ncbi:DUF2442 domain-containing protein [Azospirillum sp. sgz301742]